VETGGNWGIDFYITIAIMIVYKERSNMTKENRFLFAHDNETRSDMEELSSILHVSMSEVLRQGVETLKVKIIGKIPSSGLEMYDRLDTMHAKLIHNDGDIEIVGHDNGRE